MDYLNSGVSVLQGWKLLSKGTKSGRSADRLYSFNDQYLLYDADGEWTSRPGLRYIEELGRSTHNQNFGPLSVFNRAADLYRFIQKSDVWLYEADSVLFVWTCDYIPSNDDALWKPGAGNRALSDSIPFGTRFADSIRLVRHVPFPEFVAVAQRMNHEGGL